MGGSYQAGGNSRSAVTMQPYLTVEHQQVSERSDRITLPAGRRSRFQRSLSRLFLKPVASAMQCDTRHRPRVPLPKPHRILEVSMLGELQVTFVPIEYDHRRLANEMRDEGLPNEFVEAVLTGWWTTCLEVLPSKERRRGIF